LLLLSLNFSGASMLMLNLHFGMHIQAPIGFVRKYVVGVRAMLSMCSRTRFESNSPTNNLPIVQGLRLHLDRVGSEE
jgi:hypothetical protein